MDYEKLYKDVANDNVYCIELKSPTGEKTIFTYWTKKDFMEGLREQECFEVTDKHLKVYHLGHYNN